ncbi:methenyltetrahydromethanopterin cyclohydrolase [Lignipirellula cremea]|uniref:Methenyltetrahydromethanopterin cyclohydrolase n=1 Tax=Lignipirellula cremea TaxID=2528010 RepID=A0A518DYB5_9BACT|nr:methenyltetrahydromethanopterin cyclohydrolase [Lignipirellula cremea]QDU96839.1 Methenyltetrahydromethanopterin cyclohydrolase [Lignipirellula cremea]
MEFELNRTALAAAAPLIERPGQVSVKGRFGPGSATVIDCGIEAPGGLAAGRILAEVCLAGLATVQITPGNDALWPGPAVAVATDQPLAACMASQYAGWQIKGPKFFAMGSGPMRAAGSSEALFDEIGFRERPTAAIGVLESGRLPPDETITQIAAACQVDLDRLTLLVAPTASLAGTVQVVARSVETAMHKLHTLGFDLKQVVSGFGAAPLPPVAAEDLGGIGRTNDAILYGGQVTLWVEAEDDQLADIGPRVPSSASGDHGRPFRAIFEAYDRDFYKIDPMLFSPAVVVFNNLRTGRSFRFGELLPAVLQESFAGG